MEISLIELSCSLITYLTFSKSMMMSFMLYISPTSILAIFYNETRATYFEFYSFMFRNLVRMDTANCFNELINQNYFEDLMPKMVLTFSYKTALAGLFLTVVLVTTYKLIHIV